MIKHPEIKTKLPIVVRELENRGVPSRQVVSFFCSMLGSIQILSSVPALQPPHLAQVPNHGDSYDSLTKAEKPWVSFPKGREQGKAKDKGQSRAAATQRSMLLRKRRVQLTCTY